MRRYAVIAFILTSAIALLLGNVDAVLAQAGAVCPPAITGCTAAEKPWALCEGYSGWLADLAGMRGQTFCVVNKEEDTDGSTAEHFRSHCKKLTPCSAAAPGQQTGQPAAGQSPGATDLPKPTCKKGFVPVLTSTPITKVINGKTYAGTRTMWKCLQAKTPSKVKKPTSKKPIEPPSAAIPQYPVEEQQR